jgi:hypothetical protein
VAIFAASLFGLVATGLGVATTTDECALADGPPYYAIELVTTRNVPGTGLGLGTAEVAVPGGSPFSIGVGGDGSYVYDVTVSLERVSPPGSGRLVAWATSPDLAGVVRLGALDGGLAATGRVAWNQFIVVVTLEPRDDPAAERWSGPVAFRGMSRSGRMHTMVGHGAFQQENCAAWGYGGA